MGTRGDVQVPCHVCMHVMPLVIEETPLAMSKSQTCISAPAETVAASRVQPFVSVGVRLLEAGHRVRLASHAEFRGVVTAAGLEFYPLGGDSKSLGRCAAQSQGVLPQLVHGRAARGMPCLATFAFEIAVVSQSINLGARAAGIFPPRDFKAVDKLRSQVCMANAALALCRGDRCHDFAVVHEKEDRKRLLPMRKLTAVDLCALQIRMYLRHQLDACTLPDPEAPDVEFRVSCACQSLPWAVVIELQQTHIFSSPVFASRNVCKAPNMAASELNYRQRQLSPTQSAMATCT